jgi:hypothetical protein
VALEPWLTISFSVETPGLPLAAGQDGAAGSHRVAVGGVDAADAVQVARGRAAFGREGGPVRRPGDRAVVADL